MNITGEFIMGELISKKSVISIAKKIKPEIVAYIAAISLAIILS
jgi:hypothetical protein